MTHMDLSRIHGRAQRDSHRTTDTPSHDNSVLRLYIIAPPKSVPFIGKYVARIVVNRIGTVLPISLLLLPTSEIHLDRLRALMGNAKHYRPIDRTVSASPPSSRSDFTCVRGRRTHTASPPHPARAGTRPPRRPLHPADYAQDPRSQLL